jgi:hypothetical protein
MIAIRPAAALLGLSFTLTPAPPPPTDCGSQQTIRVLFVGNSYTYVNNVPRLVEAIASSLLGPCVESAMIAIGGASLAGHWASDSVVPRIQGGRWTYVVLQDQSELGEAWAINGRERVGTSGAELAEFAGRFAAVIKAANAKPVLLSHWAPDGAPARDQQVLDYAFTTAARATGSVLSPVGEAIKRFQSVLPSVTPYLRDGGHLSAAGSYLEALVLYSTLTDRSPVGAVHSVYGPAVDFNVGRVMRDSIVTLVDIPDSVASVLQHVAAEVHSERRGRIPLVPKPAPLAIEFPIVETNGDLIDVTGLAGRWRGSSTALPTPSGKAVEVELVLQPKGEGVALADSIYLRLPAIEMAGPLVLSVEGRQVVLRGTVTPRSRVGRTGPPTPFSLEVRAALRGKTMSGTATMHQSGSPWMPSFDGIGTFEIERVPSRGN